MFFGILDRVVRAAVESDCVTKHFADGLHPVRSALNLDPAGIGRLPKPSVAIEYRRLG
jgi:hypothetical protein